jgi:flagellar basal-body rod modification protein FlgD
MPVNPVSSTGASQAAKIMTFKADDFFKLLITELKYQDPMKPMEQKEFISQTAQFAELEEAKKASELLEAIVSGSGRGAVTAASGLIGRYAKATVDGRSISGEVTAVRWEDNSLKITIDGVTVDAQAVTEIRKGV